MNDKSFKGGFLVLLVIGGLWIWWAGGITVPGIVSGGPRTVLIVHESNDQTPAFGEMVRDLRTGPHAAYLTSKSHKLLILDDETPGPDGQPSAILAPYRPYAVPELIIAKPDGALIKRQPLPANAGAVIEAIKAQGG